MECLYFTVSQLLSLHQQEYFCKSHLWILFWSDWFGNPIHLETVFFILLDVILECLTWYVERLIMESINPDPYNPPFAFFFGVLNILIFIYFSKYETIETHARAFFTLNILAIGTVNVDEEEL